MATADWSRVIAAWEATHGPRLSPLHVAASGHENARAIVANALRDASGCTCGDDEPCTPECDPPARRELRRALAALLAELGAGHAR